MDAKERNFDHKLLNGLAPDEVTAFLRQCQKKKYPDGTCLFLEKSEAKTLYLLLEGNIELCFELPGDRSEVTTITTEEPGETIGWSAIVPPHIYRLSGYCRGETTVYEIDSGSLTILFEANYHLGCIFMRNIAELVGERFYQIQDKLAKVLGEELMSGW